MARLTTAQAAERLGVTNRTIQNYINRGLLAAEWVQNGLRRYYAIEEADLERFANEQNIPLIPVDSQ